MIYYKDFDFNVIDTILSENGLVEKKENDQSVFYADCVFTLDIETTSYFITKENKVVLFDKSLSNEFYRECKKQGMMYIWMFGIEETVVYGRTGQELKDFIDKLNKKMIINNIIVKKIIYVHNLGFDFYFLQNWLGTHWDVFAREPNKIITAKDDYIEFRCSYFLTNMTLANFAKEYHLNVMKQIGLLDYNVLRTPLTPMTEEELKYCEYDILVLYEIVKYHKKIYKDITTIPLTQTGKIRKKINAMFYKDKKHHKMIKRMNPVDFEEFNLLCQVYSGGYTHSNGYNTNKILSKVYSNDISSSYPFECVTKKYPMQSFTRALTNDLSDIDFDKYAVIIDFTVNNLKATTSNSFLSVSKAITKRFFENDEQELYIIQEPEIDNGRLRSAKSVRYILTDIDFKIFLNAYNFSKLKINNIYIAEKNYLPLKLIQFILNLYKQKTELKGIEDAAVKYTELKQFLNGIYGCFCMKIIQDDVIYENGVMTIEKLELNAAIAKAEEKLFDYNEKMNNLSFAWGVWVSAYAKQHLWRNILKIGDKVVYCDTDSIKYLYCKEAIKAFEEDEIQVRKEIDEVIKYFNDKEKKEVLKFEDFEPTDKKGKKHLIGLFEFETEYKFFRTLGAKKYAYIDNNDVLHITVSGINKIAGAKSLRTLNDFEPGHFFNYDAAGKNESYYLHDQEEVIFEDGWHEKARFGICIKPTTYLLDITDDYDEILGGYFSALD